LPPTVIAVAVLMPATGTGADHSSSAQHVTVLSGSTAQVDPKPPDPPASMAVAVIGTPGNVTVTVDCVTVDCVCFHTLTLPGVTVPPDAVTVYLPGGTVNVRVAVALCRNPAPSTVYVPERYTTTFSHPVAFFAVNTCPAYKPTLVGVNSPAAPGAVTVAPTTRRAANTAPATPREMCLTSNMMRPLARVDPTQQVRATPAGTDTRLRPPQGC
jgi:hypothetical protein